MMKKLVQVSLRARFTFPNGTTRVATVEEQVPLGEILNATTLHDAVKCFLSGSDAVHHAEEVTSFLVDGHEMIKTFMDSGVGGRYAASR